MTFILCIKAYYYKMNLQSSEYAVIGDMIIIYNYIDKQIGILDEKFKKLMFSNYDDINICIKQNNQYNSINFINWNSSLFNQPLILTNSLTHLNLGYSFNQPITLTNSLTHLTFGDDFNQPVILTNSLTHLTFGYVLINRLNCQILNI
jgi:hypothetical protein